MTWPWPYVVLAYYVVMTGWIYGVYDAAGDGATWVVSGVNLAVLVAHALAGWLLERWYAFLLPLPLALIAAPAGYPVSDYEPLPTWFGVLLATPLFAALVGAGALARWLVLRRRAVASPRSS